jgi:hypothetical protein
MSNMSKKLAEAIRSNPQPKRFEISQHKLMDFVSLTANQYLLLIAMIDRLNITHDPDSLIGRGTYKDFGYDLRQGYYKDKKALEDLGFVILDRSEYYVRLDAIMYTSKRNYDHILKKIGAKQDPFNGFRGNIPPPPPSK